MAVALEQAERKAQADVVVSNGGATNAPAAGVGAAQKGPVPKPDPSKSAENQDETVLMAMNIYAEARGESDDGKSAVGQVVYNRVNGRQSNGKAVTWWGSSIKGVITKSKQFSWLNNRSSREYKNALNPTETAMWEKSYQIAQMTVSGGGTANISKSNGVVADSYCANTPSWATADKYITKIGHHKFYTQHNLKLSGGGASSSPASAEVSASAQEAAVSLDIDAIKSWYKEKDYTRNCIRAIQRAVGFTSQADVDGYIGPNTIRKVAEWQSSKGLTPDGKFGAKSAEKAGITLATNSSSGSAGQGKTSAPAAGASEGAASGTAAQAPEGDSMTKEMSYGMYLSKYHSGLSTTSNNRDRWRLHSTLQSKLAKLDSLLQAEGLPFELFEGMRSPARQQYCKDNKKSKLGAWFGRHNYGLAADYVLKDNGQWSWETSKAGYMDKWKRLGALGQSVGLTWGGAWTSFVDLPHFELSNAPAPAKCKDIYSQSGIDGVWSKC